MSVRTVGLIYCFRWVPEVSLHCSRTLLDFILLEVRILFEELSNDDEKMADCFYKIVQF